ncbi:hypothetical protein [Nocardioides sp.]|uniref:hypothetical protein n=1 Tax=Nocardioides sp. TaxID=35761 RepID=UPI002ED2BA88
MADSATRPSIAMASRRQGGWYPLVVALGCAAAYGVFLLLPYYVNHLDAFPLEEVAAGDHHPKDLWPLDTALGGIVFRLGGIVTVLVGPGVELGVLAWALLWLHRDRAAPWRLRGTSLVAAVVASSTLVWLVTPFGTALMKWWLD